MDPAIIEGRLNCSGLLLFRENEGQNFGNALFCYFYIPHTNVVLDNEQ